MRILIDCTTLGSGGGIQAAVTFIFNINSRNPGIEWIAVVPLKMKEQISKIITDHKKIIYVKKINFLSMFAIYFKLKSIESKFKPDIVYTIFGPTPYKARVPHVIGFALPTIIYPWPIILIKKTFSNRLKDYFRYLLLKRFEFFLVLLVLK